MDYYLSGAMKFAIDFADKNRSKRHQCLFEKKNGQKGKTLKYKYLSGRENISTDLLSRIPQKLEHESVIVEHRADDKIYEINIIKNHWELIMFI